MGALIEFISLTACRQLQPARNSPNPSVVTDIRPLADALPDTKTQTLFKTDEMLVLRLVLPFGKIIAEHQAAGEITVACLEVQVAFTTMGKERRLSAGQIPYLSAAEPHALEPHALEALEDSSVLVTILLRKS